MTAPTSPTHPTRLLVMDVDSTFIRDEVIELLAEAAGTRELVADITSRAMHGELDFAASLRERVGTLAGLPDGVFADALRQVRPTPGCGELVAECHRRGWLVGLVSGGFHEVVDPLAARFEVDLVLANHLEVEAGHLTGRTRGLVVDRSVKRHTALTWAADHGLTPAELVAVGDGANDLEMIGAAGIGIAFCAKPVVRDAAPFHVTVPDLRVVLDVVDAVDTARAAAH